MGQIEDQMRDSIQLLGWTFPHFLVIHSHISYVETKSVPTACISNLGRIYFNPDFMKEFQNKQKGGVVAHELMHLALLHHDRKGERDHLQWNVACDWAINRALKRDSVDLPECAIFPPDEFDQWAKGKEDYYTAEVMYDWIRKNPKFAPKGMKVVACGGCGVKDEGGEGGEKNIPDWEQVSVRAAATAKLAGSGSSHCASLLDPPPAQISWKKIIRKGFAVAQLSMGKEDQSYSRRNRRTDPDGVIIPGWTSFKPSIAFIDDVSGSMSRDWIVRQVGEIKGCLKQFPGARAFLCVHTDVVVWKGWITQKTNFTEAFQFSGGTCPIEAYMEVNKAGPFSTIVHFTDCEFAEPWPQMNAKQLIVGKFGPPDSGCKPPPSTKIIPCATE